MSATTVTTIPVIPSAAVSTDQVRSVSVGVSTPIFEKIQNPLLFIQSPIRDPLPMAQAR